MNKDNTTLTYTLLSDGSSDKMLSEILSWLLDQHTELTIDPQWADLRQLPKPPKNLSERIKIALHIYPCDILFIHRDAETMSYDARYNEIRTAYQQSGANITHICVIPIRMQEAWFLFDEQAIRQASGNPNGQKPLKLPDINRVESIPNPKEELYSLLKTASGLGTNRRVKFNVHSQVHRLAALIDDYSELRKISAFQKLEEEVKQVLESLQLGKQQGG
jgi:hypothetical protein